VLPLTKDQVELIIERPGAPASGSPCSGKLMPGGGDIASEKNTHKNQ
jgi:hypothetical protein